MFFEFISGQKPNEEETKEYKNYYLNYFKENPYATIINFGLEMERLKDKIVEIGTIKRENKNAYLGAIVRAAIAGWGNDEFMIKNRMKLEEAYGN